MSTTQYEQLIDAAATLFEPDDNFMDQRSAKITKLMQEVGN